MKKAISYIRMSTEKQLKGNSLHRQLELTKKYAASNNLNLVENLQDLGLSAFSGRHKKTGEFGKFIKGVEDGSIDSNIVLLVESLDRLSRQNPLKAFNQFSTILEHGVEIHTIFDGQKYTTESVSNNPGQLFLSIGSMMRAYDESKTKSERLKKAWIHKRANLSNQILTHITPAWLEYDDKKSKFKVIPDMAKSIRKIFDLSINENRGCYAITQYLNQNIQEYPKITSSINNNKKVNTWGQSYVRKILVNPAVYGLFQPHKMVDSQRVPDGDAIENYFPAVISKEDFLLSCEKMKQRKMGGSGRKGATVTNIFTQLLICGECGQKLILKNKGKPPKGDKYLGCTYSNEGRCNSTNWRYDEFESAFLTYLTELPLQDVFSTTDSKNKRAAIEKHLASLNKQLLDEQNKYNTLTDRLSMVDTSLVQDLSDKMLAIKQDIDNLKSQIEMEQLALNGLIKRNPHKTQQGLIRGIKEYELSKSPDEINRLRHKLHALIREMVDKVIVHSSFPTIGPWETNLLDSDFIDQFNKEHSNRSEYRTLEELLSSDFGQRKLNHFQRYFIVHFKNGIEKMVHPSKDLAFKVFKPIKS